METLRIITSEKERNITTRPITNKEKMEARKLHLIGLFLFPFASLIIYILLSFNKIPQLAKIGGIVIAVIAILIFLIKQLKLEKEIKEGNVQEIQGKITLKKKFGGSKGKSKPYGSRGSKRSQQITNYIIHLNEESFWIKAKQYSNVEVGMHVKLVQLPKSKIILEVLPTSSH